MKVVDWVKKWSIYTPDKIAIKELESGKSMSYGHLERNACQLANYLTIDLGLKKEDVIAVIAENCIEYILLLSVAQKTGIVIAPLNYRLQSGEIDYLLEVIKPQVLLSDQKYIEKVNTLKAIPETTAILKIEELLTRCKTHSTTFINAVIEDSSTALIIFTSGTTGLPKGSIYTHKMMHWNSINTGLRLDITSKDRSVNCAPPFHTGGWNVLLTPFLHHGAFTLLMKGFDPEKILHILEEELITIWWAVPTMLKMMQNTPSFNTVNLSNIRYFIVGGEAMPLPLIKLWHDRGIPIRQGYGLTEVGPNVTSLNEEDCIRKIGSIGQPNFYYDIRVINKEGEEVSSNVTGELWLSGPTVSPGYINVLPNDNTDHVNGWFKTGDIVKIDEEGFIYVVDRIKHMYISGGENVYPAEVENIIRQIKGVDEVAVIGIPHEKWGETGKAIIVTKKGASLSSEEVINYCTEKLARFKVPTEVDFVSELPKNDAGKIDKKALRN